MLREREGGGTNRVLFSRLIRHPARKWSGEFQPRSPHWAKGGWKWRVEVGVQSCAVCISRDGNNLLHASTGADRCVVRMCIALLLFLIFCTYCK